MSLVLFTRMFAEGPDILFIPDVIGIGKCTINDYHAFNRQFGDEPCYNCRRDFCSRHAAHELGNELLPRLCAECDAAYAAQGTEGLQKVRERLFRTYGS